MPVNVAAIIVLNGPSISSNNVPNSSHLLVQDVLPTNKSLPPLDQANWQDNITVHSSDTLEVVLDLGDIVLFKALDPTVVSKVSSLVASKPPFGGFCNNFSTIEDGVLFLESDMAPPMGPVDCHIDAQSLLVNHYHCDAYTDTEVDIMAKCYAIIDDDLSFSKGRGKRGRLFPLALHVLVGLWPVPVLRKANLTYVQPHVVFVTIPVVKSEALALNDTKIDDVPVYDGDSSKMILNDHVYVLDNVHLEMGSFISPIIPPSEVVCVNNNVDTLLASPSSVTNNFDCEDSGLHNVVHFADSIDHSNWMEEYSGMGSLISPIISPSEVVCVNNNVDTPLASPSSVNSTNNFDSEDSGLHNVVHFADSIDHSNWMEEYSCNKCRHGDIYGKKNKKKMEANACAHGIAKWGYDLDSIVEFLVSNIPPHIKGSVEVRIQQLIVILCQLQEEAKGDRLIILVIITSSPPLYLHPNLSRIPERESGSHGRERMREKKRAFAAAAFQAFDEEVSDQASFPPITASLSTSKALMRSFPPLLRGGNFPSMCCITTKVPLTLTVMVPNSLLDLGPSKRYSPETKEDPTLFVSIESMFKEMEHNVEFEHCVDSNSEEISVKENANVTNNMVTHEEREEGEFIPQ
ncbi:hypothetical protein MA16_Dca012373 [Dendrobium catenatum]|uniref:Uncharacterized protein n=1 Tax=Dendrobium catenatum TaxID=906689 RepID=A0A2I0VI53_9ASPA|nr:hypothetical protein MA16_Dca012373 [Dendrobium catenatum]